MEKRNEEREQILKRIRRGFNAMEVTSRINSFVIENVALGRIKPKEKIPFDYYVEILNLQIFQPYELRHLIAGFAVDDDECVADKPQEEYAFEFFADAMELIFIDAKRAPENYYKDDIMPFVGGLHEYLFGLFATFKEILATEVDCDLLELTFDDVIERDTRNALSDFVSAVITKPLKEGKRVSSYLKKIKTVPEYIRRLIAGSGAKSVLKNADIDSKDYKLALFSVIAYQDSYNAALFMRKLKTWEKSSAE